MITALRGVFWVCVYALVALAPLFAALVDRAPGQGWVVDFSVGLGFSALVIFVLQFGLVARFQRVSAPFGMDALIQYHRQIAGVALAFALLHPMLLFADDPSKLALLDVRTAPNRARFALTSVVLLLALVGTSIWRERLKLSYEAWQRLHGALALGVVAAAVLHAVGVDHYATTPAQQALWWMLGAGLVGVVLWQRLLRPLRLRARPWRVAEVLPERGRATTLVFEPVGHAGMTFSPGQFAWLRIRKSPFSITAHPFSFTSSAEQAGRVAMTIKSRGDFTAAVAELVPGDQATLDGPHGLFSTDRYEGPGFVFIGGGIGITPLISMLRTMEDRQDRRPVWLFYGSPDWESVTFREELERLSQVLALTVVHTLDDPPEHWSGEVGFVGPEMLRRHLPEPFVRLQVFACGPLAMMDAVEDACASLGLPDERVHTERFEMV